MATRLTLHQLQLLNNIPRDVCVCVPAHCHIELPGLLQTRLHAPAQLAALPRNSRSLRVNSSEPGSFTFALLATCLTEFSLPDEAELHRCSQQESRRLRKVCLKHYTALLEILQVQTKRVKLLYVLFT